MGAETNPWLWCYDQKTGKSPEVPNFPQPRLPLDRTRGEPGCGGVRGCTTESVVVQWRSKEEKTQNSVSQAVGDGGAKVTPR